MLAQEQRLTDDVLRQLPYDKREILTRFYIEEQPKEQIIDEMGLRKEGESQEQAETRFRLLKSRAKEDFARLGKKKLDSHVAGLQALRNASGAGPGELGKQKPAGNHGNGHDARAASAATNGNGTTPAHSVKDGDERSEIAERILERMPKRRIPDWVERVTEDDLRQARKRLIEATLGLDGVSRSEASSQLAKTYRQFRPNGHGVSVSLHGDSKAIQRLLTDSLRESGAAAER